MGVALAPGWPGTYYPHLTKLPDLTPMAGLTRSAEPGGRQVFPGVPMRQPAPPAWGPCPETGRSPSPPGSDWVALHSATCHLEWKQDFQEPTRDPSPKRLTQLAAGCLLPWPGTMALVSIWCDPSQGSEDPKMPRLLEQEGPGQPAFLSSSPFPRLGN